MGGNARCGRQAASGISAGRSVLSSRLGQAHSSFRGSIRRCRSSWTTWRRRWPRVEAGARDLVLRDWSGERIGELREVVDGLVERTAFPLGVEIDSARADLSSDWFTAWLAQVDGSGAARPRYSWAPGKDESPPVPARRLSAEWSDSLWIEGAAPEQLDGAGQLRPILERSLAGTRPTVPELEALFCCQGRPGRCCGLDRRRSPQEGLRRRSELRHQPQHQLHEHVLFPLRVLCFLERSP
jgi:hypothetical protein